MNIAQICPQTETLGPGRRFVIWVQGCPFKCHGCISPDWIEQRSANRIKAEELADYIISVANAKNLEGLTISGGEPMLQASAIVTLLDRIRKKVPDFSAIAFSGYTLAQLRKKALSDTGIADLLSRLDVLIDGLYINDKNDGKGLRGSSNQQINFLTARYRRQAKEFYENARSVEIHLLDGEMLLVGVPSPNISDNFSSIADILNKGDI